MIGTLDQSEIVATIRDALLVLDEDLTVEFANRSFLETFQVAEHETVGRRLQDLGDGQWDIPALRELLERILPERESIEAFEVEHEFEAIGRKVMRLNARRTVRPGNGSRRILLAIEDITETHDLARELGRQRRLAQGIVDTVREPLLVLDGDLRVIAASRSFYAVFGVTEAETLGHRLPELGNGQWEVPELRRLLERIIPEHETVEDYEIDHAFPRIGRRQMLLNARKIYREGNNTKAFLLAMEDVTERREVERERGAALGRAEDLLEELNHRVMNSLTIIGSIVALEARRIDGTAAEAAFERVRGRIEAVGQLYRTLARGNAIETVQADEYLRRIADDVVASLADGGGGKVELRLDIARVPLSTSVAVPLGLMLNELVTNSLKYAFAPDGDGTLSVTLTTEGNDFVFTVGDDGRGIDADARVDSGVGARLVTAFAKQLHGRISRESDPSGTRVVLRFPARVELDPVRRVERTA